MVERVQVWEQEGTLLYWGEHRSVCLLGTEQCYVV